MFVKTELGQHGSVPGAEPERLTAGRQAPMVACLLNGLIYLSVFITCCPQTCFTSQQGNHAKLVLTDSLCIFCLGPSEWYMTAWLGPGDKDDAVTSSPYLWCLMEHMQRSILQIHL
ncbi:unnamed protein product [Lepidochelys kempii]